MARNIVLGALVLFGFGFFAPPADHPSPDIDRVIMLTNQERRAYSLPELTYDQRLAMSADFHNRWMRDRNCFEHICDGEPDIPSRVNTAGYVQSFWAENIAIGYRPPGEVVAAWLDSPDHRENILSPYVANVGCAYLAPSHWWTCDFAAPRSPSLTLS